MNDHDFAAVLIQVSLVGLAVVLFVLAGFYRP